MFCLAGNGTQVQHRVYTETPDGSLFLHSFYPVNITFKEMVSCEESKEAVLIAFPFFPHYKAASDSDVAFQMINDDVAETLKQVVSECPSYDLIVPALLQFPLGQLHAHCHLTPGIPVQPMLAKPTKGISEVLDRLQGREFTCEYKYDGGRGRDA